MATSTRCRPALSSDSSLRRYFPDECRCAEHVTREEPASRFGLRCWATSAPPPASALPHARIASACNPCARRSLVRRAERSNPSVGAGHACCVAWANASTRRRRHDGTRAQRSSGRLLIRFTMSARTAADAESATRDAGAWQERYRAKIATPAAAIRAIRPGRRILIGSGAGGTHLLGLVLGRTR